jgi:competence protein ComEC
LKYFFIFLSVFSIFAWRFITFSRPVYPDGAKIKITAVLKEEPKISGSVQKFTLAGIKIVTDCYPEYHWGDHLVVLGRVKNQTLEFGQIEKKTEEGFDLDTFGALIGKYRKGVLSAYKKWLPEPQASLMAGIVLGSKESLPAEFYRALQRSGTMHIVVASGTNVTLLAGTAVSFFLLFFSRRLAVILSFIMIWFYVVLAGADPPVIRAGIMGSLAFLAMGLGRQADAWRGLALSAAVMLFINPDLLFDIGFQLSFSAVFGILFFGPRFLELFKRLPTQIKGDLSQTLAAQIATLPILLYNFHYYSPWSIPANLLIVSVIPVIMRLGMIGAFFPPVLWLALPLLSWIVLVVELFGK